MNTLFLTKLLFLFVYPLGAALLVCITALTLSFTPWRRSAQLLLSLALVALWIAATPGFASWLTWRVASQYPGFEPPPKSDAVILLGGETASRSLAALWAYRDGKAPYIVISGGGLPWHETLPEAQRSAELLINLGVPRSNIIPESRSRNTRENAVNTAGIFKQHGWQSGVLVTSAVHMPRALAAFRKVGLDVTPGVFAFAEPSHFLSLLDLLPDAGALAATTAAVKEIIGLQAYRLLGWA
jgi:uncharacterized SAM-binding protein YcdF (DUF218 family)